MCATSDDDGSIVEHIEHLLVADKRIEAWNVCLQRCTYRAHAHANEVSVSFVFSALARSLLLRSTYSPKPFACRLVHGHDVRLLPC